jgi:hypothetical protein
MRLARLGGPILALLLFAASAAAQPDAAPKPPPRLEVGLELMIGVAEGQQPYVFGGIRNVTAGPGGRIIAVDRLDLLLRVFDPTGQFLYAFGSAETPLSGAQVLRVVGNDVEVYDRSNRRLTTYALDGGFVRDRTIADAPVSTTREVPLRYGWVFGTTSSTATDSLRFVLLADAGHRVDTVATHATGWALRNRPDLGLKSPALSLGPGGDWAVAGDSLVAIVDAYEGIISWQRVDPSGLMAPRTRDLEWTPVRIERADVTAIQQRVREVHQVPRGQSVSVETPRFYGRVARALLDDRGRVWLQMRDRFDVTDDWLIVGAEPSEDARVSLPTGFTPLAIANDRIYGGARSGDGVWRVIVYHIEDPRVQR